ncbi:MAG: hypothetical protein HY908_25725, partial [Myxococcales bacterium]|nr:hypothetical protein [Myxococcales bacterium]
MSSGRDDDPPVAPSGAPPPASSARRFPPRPRLAEHVLPRLHLVEGVERAVLHDTARDEVLVLDPRELTLVLAADGTRDFDGIVLAASRAGAYRRASEIARLFADLEARGMLASGVRARSPVPRAEPGRPLEPLPAYRFACDGNGACCRTYGSIPFGALEVARARTLLSEPLGAERDRLFVPLFGSTGERSAVTMVDGRCAFLDGRERCRLELAATAARPPTGGAGTGPDDPALRGKPRGCQTYPTTFVDDGVAVRVSLVVECPCALTSLEAGGGPAEGGGLVPAGARSVGELWPGAGVLELPVELAVAGDRPRESRAALRRWSEVVCQALLGVGAALDGVSVAWSLAEAARTGGLSEAAARAAVSAARPVEVGALAPWLEALALHARAKCAATASWRARADRTRWLAAWIGAGASELERPGAAARALAGDGARPEHERLFLRALVWGLHLAASDRSLELALR